MNQRNELVRRVGSRPAYGEDWLAELEADLHVATSYSDAFLTDVETSCFHSRAYDRLMASRHRPD